MGVAGHFGTPSGTAKMRAQSLSCVANPRRVDTRAQRVTPFAGPVALLVDELSISTTEIFAGGLQALGRARVFGSQTSGQALPSVPERLPNGDILYHAIADFLSPVGKPLEGAGVTPDEITPVTRRALLAGKDPARDAALAWAARRRDARKERDDGTSSSARLKMRPALFQRSVAFRAEIRRI
jgi:carboxyl-terminal processing protease